MVSGMVMGLGSSGLGVVGLVRSAEVVCDSFLDRWGKSSGNPMGSDCDAVEVLGLPCLSSCSCLFFPVWLSGELVFMLQSFVFFSAEWLTPKAVGQPGLFFGYHPGKRAEPHQRVL